MNAVELNLKYKRTKIKEIDYVKFASASSRVLEGRKDQERARVTYFHYILFLLAK